MPNLDTLYWTVMYFTDSLPVNSWTTELYLGGGCILSWYKEAYNEAYSSEEPWPVQYNSSRRDIVRKEAFIPSCQGGITADKVTGMRSTKYDRKWKKGGTAKGRKGNRSGPQEGKGTARVHGEERNAKNLKHCPHLSQQETRTGDKTRENNNVTLVLS